MSRRLLALGLACLVLLTACATEERRELRLTRTSTVETGVRILADNCPGPSSVALLVRDDVLWEVRAPVEAEETQTTDDAEEALENEPGLVEFLVGQTPEDWETVTPLTACLLYTSDAADE